MLSHPDKHIANPSLSVRAAALEAAVTLSEARAELLATGSASSLPDPPFVLDLWATHPYDNAVLFLACLMALLVLCVRLRASLRQMRCRAQHHPDNTLVAAAPRCGRTLQCEKCQALGSGAAECWPRSAGSHPEALNARGRRPGGSLLRTLNRPARHDLAWRAPFWQRCNRGNITLGTDVRSTQAFQTTRRRREGQPNLFSTTGDKWRRFWQTLVGRSSSHITGCGAH